jgi:hypothetical protein
MLPRELDVNAERDRVVMSRGAATLILDFGARTVELRA